MIRRARPKHLTDINTLLAYYDNPPLPSESLNAQDITLIACEAERIVGMLWCGVMAQGTIGYVGAFVVAPDYAHKGIGRALSAKLVELAERRKMKRIGAHIACGEHQEKVAALSTEHGFQMHNIDSIPITLDIGI